MRYLTRPQLVSLISRAYLSCDRHLCNNAAVKQILEHGHSAADVSRRLGVSTHSLYKWIRLQQIPAAQRQEQVSQSEELRRIKAELKRVTEERDILKKAAAYFARQCD